MDIEDEELLKAAEAGLEESERDLRTSQVAMVLQLIEMLGMVIKTSNKRVSRLAEATEAVMAPWKGLDLTDKQSTDLAAIVADLEAMSAKVADMPRALWASGGEVRDEFASLGIAFDADAVFQVVVDAGGDVDVAMPSVLSLVSLTTPGPMTPYRLAEE